jgi:acyl carrier protein
MTREEIIAKVQDIFRRELGNESIVLKDETVAEDIQEWTSLSHAQLVIAMEKELNIKFSLREMMSWQNVGEIVNSIEKKIG